MPWQHHFYNLNKLRNGLPIVSCKISVLYSKEESFEWIKTRKLVIVSDVTNILKINYIFFDFYGYLCNYAHCNYSVAACYIDKHGMYTCDKVTNDFLAKILTLFVFTKIFESIVTVEGEGFQSPYVEKECYKLVEEVTEYLFYQLEYFSKYECKDVNPELNKHMKDMFKNMKKSLKEELGSVDKEFLN